jgi:hypothetical protein
VHDARADASNELTDAMLLASIASGDRAALSVLVHRHWASLFRYTRRMTGDEASAEDALQDTFVAWSTPAPSAAMVPRARGSTRSRAMRCDVAHDGASVSRAPPSSATTSRASARAPASAA